MRTSNYLLATHKETPADAEILSHQLMLRAGLIRKLASGLYTWLPTGLRVLQKVANIVREEMNQVGAIEILMPAIQPAELWQETGRWQQFGSELLQINDRHGREFCFGPTHEEVITDILRTELNSYKQLPVTFFQIQTKFRDEIRPRFGVMRSREFLMKDAYSFHTSEQSLEQTYEIMYVAYQRIFTRMGLEFRAVLADTGSIGGKVSHEFQVLAAAGEDQIAYSDQSDYAANVELAEALAPQGKRATPNKAMQRVNTPNTTSIAEVCKFLNVEAKQTIKTLLVKGAESSIVGLVLRGDHQLNIIKAEKLPQVAAPLTFINEQEITDTLSCKPGYIGPIGLSIPLIVDHSAAHCTDFVCGANQIDKHYINANWERDVPLESVADLRDVVEGDPSPDGKGVLKFVRGIEVGHIFQLGNKYSKVMNAKVLNEQGKDVLLEMGCYGIGISRIVAASIEQHHDDKGIIWPESIAPFQVILIPINMQKSQRLREAIETLYQELVQADIEVLFDDRNERPGAMFANADLLGIPHRLVLSERGLDAGTIEYKHRRESESCDIPVNEAMQKIRKVHD